MFAYVRLGSCTHKISSVRDPWLHTSASIFVADIQRDRTSSTSLDWDSTVCSHVQTFYAY